MRDNLILAAVILFFSGLLVAFVFVGPAPDLHGVWRY